MISDWVQGFGYSLVCQILLHIMVSMSVVASPPCFSSSAVVNSYWFVTFQCLYWGFDLNHAVLGNCPHLKILQHSICLGSLCSGGCTVLNSIQSIFPWFPFLLRLLPFLPWVAFTLTCFSLVRSFTSCNALLVFLLERLSLMSAHCSSLHLSFPSNFLVGLHVFCSSF